MKLLIYRTILMSFRAGYILFYYVDLNKIDDTDLFNTAKMKARTGLCLTIKRLVVIIQYYFYI